MIGSLVPARACRARVSCAHDGEQRTPAGRRAGGRAAPGRPGDVAAVTTLYLELSPRSFYLRFHSQRPVPARVARLASLDSGTVCLVAAAPADPHWLAAEARCVRIDAETAELGLAVRDGYQGAGMGHLLLEALVLRARRGSGGCVPSSFSTTPRCCACSSVMAGCWPLPPKTSPWPSWRSPPSAGCQAGPRCLRDGGFWWNGAAGPTMSRSRRCVRRDRRSASAPGRSGRPGEPARWSPPGGAGSPRRQT